LATACGPAASPGRATPKPPPDKVTFITDFAAFGYTSPFYAGVEQGFFKDENIDLAITLGQGSADAATKVGAGAAQFGLADTITSVVAIEGLKFGAAAGDAYLVILPDLMRTAGANADKYQVITMAAAATTAALISGQVDATTVGVATFSSRALGVKAQGFTLKMFRFSENGLEALGHSIIVNSDLVSRNRDLVQRFMRAYAKSIVWSQQSQNIDKAVDAYMKVNPQQNREGEKANYVATIPFQLDEKAAGSVGLFVFPKAKTDKTLALANKAYNLSVAADAVYTNEFALALPEALRKGKLP